MKKFSFLYNNIVNNFSVSFCEKTYNNRKKPAGVICLNDNGWSNAAE